MYRVAVGDRVDLGAKQDASAESQSHVSMMITPASDPDALL